MGGIDYNYQINKCNNLKSTETDYDFTHIVETNTQYSSSCYFLKNHLLAEFSYYFGYGLGFTIGIVITLFNFWSCVFTFS